MIAIGQSWVSASGVTYTIEAEIKGGYSVAVRDEDGPVTASDGRWHFTPTKLRNLIEAQGLKLYDASAALDRIAEKLESKKLVVLAAEIDSIASEYVEARPPLRLKRDRQREIEEQQEALIDQLEQSDDPENQERILDQLQDVGREHEGVRDRISEDTRVHIVTPISDEDRVGQPHTVSKP